MQKAITPKCYCIFGRILILCLFNEYTLMFDKGTLLLLAEKILQLGWSVKYRLFVEKKEQILLLRPFIPLLILQNRQCNCTKKDGKKQTKKNKNKKRHLHLLQQSVRVSEAIGDWYIWRTVGETWPVLSKCDKFSIGKMRISLEFYFYHIFVVLGQAE